MILLVLYKSPLLKLGGRHIIYVQISDNIQGRIKAKTRKRERRNTGKKFLPGVSKAAAAIMQK